MAASSWQSNGTEDNYFCLLMEGSDSGQSEQGRSDEDVIFGFESHDDARNPISFYTAAA